MNTNPNPIKRDNDDRSHRIRSFAYWILSAIATLIFLMFTYVMSMVPGLYLHEKLLMLVTAGVLLVASLGIGLWKFRTNSAPVMAWPVGPIVCVVLLFELAECIIGIFQVS